MNEITPETFEPLDLANLISSTTCVVLKFSASWCGPCKSKPFKDNYNILKQKFSSKIIKFIELDVDEFSELIESKEYYDIEIKSIPYFKIAYNGVWAKDFSGTSCIEEIDGILNKITQKHIKSSNQQIKDTEDVEH